MNSTLAYPDTTLCDWKGQPSVLAFIKNIKYISGKLIFEFITVVIIFI